MNININNTFNKNFQKNRILNPNQNNVKYNHFTNLSQFTNFSRNNHTSIDQSPSLNFKLNEENERVNQKEETYLSPNVKEIKEFGSIEDEMIMIINQLLNIKDKKKEEEEYFSSLSSKVKNSLLEEIQQPLSLVNASYIKQKEITQMNQIHNKNIACILSNLKEYQDDVTNYRSTYNSSLDKSHQDVIEIINAYLKNKSCEKINQPISQVKEQEFVSTINDLSSSIRNFMKGAKGNIKTLHSSFDVLSQSMFLVKSMISEMNKQVYSTSQLSKEKSKTTSLIDKVNEMSLYKSSIEKNIKAIDISIVGFYDEAKVIFKKIKQIHSEMSVYNKENPKDFNIEKTYQKTIDKERMNKDKTLNNNQKEIEDVRIKSKAKANFYIRPKSTCVNYISSDTNSNSNMMKSHIRSKSPSLQVSNINNLYNIQEKSRNMMNNNIYKDVITSNTVQTNHTNGNIMSRISQTSENFQRTMMRSQNENESLNKEDEVLSIKKIYKEEIKRLTDQNLNLKCEMLQLKTSFASRKGGNIMITEGNISKDAKEAKEKENNINESMTSAINAKNLIINNLKNRISSFYIELINEITKKIDDQSRINLNDKIIKSYEKWFSSEIKRVNYSIPTSTEKNDNENENNFENTNLKATLNEEMLKKDVIIKLNEDEISKIKLENERVSLELSKIMNEIKFEVTKNEGNEKKIDLLTKEIKQQSEVIVLNNKEILDKDQQILHINNENSKYKTYIDSIEEELSRERLINKNNLEKVNERTIKNKELELKNEDLKKEIDEKKKKNEEIEKLLINGRGEFENRISELKRVSKEEISSLQQKIEEFNNEFKEIYITFKNCELADDYQINNCTIPEIIMTLGSEIKNKLEEFDILEKKFLLEQENKSRLLAEKEALKKSFENQILKSVEKEKEEKDKSPVDVELRRIKEENNKLVITINSLEEIKNIKDNEIELVDKEKNMLLMKIGVKEKEISEMRTEIDKEKEKISELTMRISVLEKEKEEKEEMIKENVKIIDKLNQIKSESISSKAIVNMELTNHNMTMENELLIMNNDEMDNKSDNQNENKYENENENESMTDYKNEYIILKEEFEEGVQKYEELYMKYERIKKKYDRIKELNPNIQLTKSKESLVYEDIQKNDKLENENEIEIGKNEICETINIVKDDNNDGNEEKKYTISQLKEENKELTENNIKLKELFEYCTGEIFNYIKETSPELIEQEMADLDSKNSNNDVEFIEKSVEIFKKYLEQVTESISRLEEDNNRFQKIIKIYQEGSKDKNIYNSINTLINKNDLDENDDATSDDENEKEEKEEKGENRKYINVKERYRVPSDNLNYIRDNSDNTKKKSPISIKSKENEKTEEGEININKLNEKDKSNSPIDNKTIPKNRNQNQNQSNNSIQNMVNNINSNQKSLYINMYHLNQNQDEENSQNEELNEINEINENEQIDNFYSKFNDPDQYKIVISKEFLTYKWYLICEKDKEINLNAKSSHENEYDICEFFWVPSDFITDEDKFEVAVDDEEFKLVENSIFNKQMKELQLENNKLRENMDKMIKSHASKLQNVVTQEKYDHLLQKLKEEKERNESLLKREYSNNSQSQNKVDEKEKNMNRTVHEIPKSKGFLELLNQKERKSIKDEDLIEDDTENLLQKTIFHLKEELKATRKERDEALKDYNKAISLSGQKEHLIEMMKTSMNSLIIEIQITSKIKEILNVMMSILNYSEDEKRYAFEGKDNKKKGLFGFGRSK